MKKLLPLLALGFLWSTAVSAQETWTLQPVATEVLDGDFGRLDTNKATCARFGLAAGETDAAQCTQASACSAVPACAGGASCTAVQAIACNRRIYPNSTAGREQWAGIELVRPALALIHARRAPTPGAGSDLRAYCLNFWIPASQVTRDGECTKSGLPPSCNICPLTF